MAPYPKIASLDTLRFNVTSSHFQVYLYCDPQPQLPKNSHDVLPDPVSLGTWRVPKSSKAPRPSSLQYHWREFSWTESQKQMFQQADRSIFVLPEEHGLSGMKDYCPVLWGDGDVRPWDKKKNGTHLTSLQLPVEDGLNSPYIVLPRELSLSSHSTTYFS